MSKFKRLSLMESMERFPLMNEEARRSLRGGCSNCEQFPGMVVSFEDYERMEANGTWTGGLVCGIGYILPDADVYGEYTGRVEYCPWHDLEIIDNECLGCYYDGFDYCGNHGIYIERFGQCSECEAYYDLPPYCDHGTPFGGTERGYCEDCDRDDGDTPGEGNNNKPGEGGETQPGEEDSGNTGKPATNQNLKDGVNVYNSKNFTFNMTGNNTFEGQLKRVLQSNSVLKNVLSYFDKGYIRMTFEVGKTDNAHAQTFYPSEEAYRIVFDQKYVDGNGWNNTIFAQDNVGYDWSKVKNNEEALVVTMIHEALHAKHYAIYQEANRQGDYWPDQSAQYLLNNGYSREFINVFYAEISEGVWEYSKNHENNMEEYIRNYDHGVIDAALAEYRKDYGK